ncbi:DUF6855 family protein [Micromonospora sp. DT81.3]|uniref:DUF6855 family protein n=1 Tax=Micromonospora sp. DT81.3 TaxID=3416523 RepID=UPI003CF0FE1E
MSGWGSRATRREEAGIGTYTMYRDDQADPPALVCRVGAMTLTYHASAIDDLAAWLREQGDWVPLGAADEQKPAADGTVEAWGRDLTARTRFGE